MLLKFSNYKRPNVALLDLNKDKDFLTFIDLHSSTLDYTKVSMTELQVIYRNKILNIKERTQNSTDLDFIEFDYKHIKLMDELHSHFASKDSDYKVAINRRCYNSAIDRSIKLKSNVTSSNNNQDSLVENIIDSYTTSFADGTNVNVFKNNNDAKILLLQAESKCNFIFKNKRYYNGESDKKLYSLYSDYLDKKSDASELILFVKKNYNLSLSDSEHTTNNYKKMISKFIQQFTISDINALRDYHDLALYSESLCLSSFESRLILSVGIHTFSQYYISIRQVGGFKLLLEHSISEIILTQSNPATNFFTCYSKPKFVVPLMFIVIAGGISYTTVPTEIIQEIPQISYFKPSGNIGLFAESFSHFCGQLTYFCSSTTKYMIRGAVEGIYGSSIKEQVAIKATETVIKSSSRVASTVLEVSKSLIQNIKKSLFSYFYIFFGYYLKYFIIK